MSEDVLMTPEEVAGLLRVSKGWVYRAAAAGALPHVRLGRSVRFRRAAIDTYIGGVESGGEVAVERGRVRRVKAR